MLVSPEHPLNASSPILVTLSGSVMLVRLPHQLNALSPILVTLLGSAMLVSPEHPLKAPSPILVTLSGITVVFMPVTKVFVLVAIIPLQFPRLSYVRFPSATVMPVIPEHPSNAPSPILVTLSGSVMLVNLLQFPNA